MISAAYNETFVFIGLVRPGHGNIIHCNKNGKILFERHFKTTLSGFVMITEKEVIIPVC
jgi:hypothetical protein